jgi:hypothetical protein
LRSLRPRNPLLAVSALRSWRACFSLRTLRSLRSRNPLLAVSALRSWRACFSLRTLRPRRTLLAFGSLRSRRTCGKREGGEKSNHGDGCTHRFPLDVNERSHRRAAMSMRIECFPSEPTRSSGITKQKLCLSYNIERIWRRGTARHNRQRRQAAGVLSRSARKSEA